MRCCWFAVTLVFTLPANAQTDPSLVIPGKSVGPITAETTPAQLNSFFAVSQMKDKMVSSGGDAEPELATVINGDNPETALTVFWRGSRGKGPHPAATAHPDSINLCYGNDKPPKACIWHLANHVSFGTTLRDLERLNGKPYQLAGFEWDYSGMVTNWNGGKLQNAWNSCGQVLLRLQPNYGVRGPNPQQQKLYQQVMGDGNFPSSNPAMQQLNPVVYAITVKLSASGNCPAS
jgi:hypothetical protein